MEFRLQLGLLLLQLSQTVGLLLDLLLDGFGLLQLGEMCIRDSLEALALLRVRKSEKGSAQ